MELELAIMINLCKSWKKGYKGEKKLVEQKKIEKQAEIKLDTILNNFVFKRTPIYIDDDYSNLYNSKISSNSMLSLIFNRLAFKYSCTDAYNPYVLLVVYITIDLLILTGAFLRYIRHDFK